jgi:hypothetical protein
MADLERFWRKTPLGPLGVKQNQDICAWALVIRFETLSHCSNCKKLLEIHKYNISIIIVKFNS